MPLLNNVHLHPVFFIRSFQLSDVFYKSFYFFPILSHFNAVVEGVLF